MERIADQLSEDRLNQLREVERQLAACAHLQSAHERAYGAASARHEKSEAAAVAAQRTLASLEEQERRCRAQGSGIAGQSMRLSWEVKLRQLEEKRQAAEEHLRSVESELERERRNEQVARDHVRRSIMEARSCFQSLDQLRGTDKTTVPQQWQQQRPVSGVASTPCTPSARASGATASPFNSRPTRTGTPSARAGNAASPPSASPKQGDFRARLTHQASFTELGAHRSNSKRTDAAEAGKSDAHHQLDLSTRSPESSVKSPGLISKSPRHTLFQKPPEVAAASTARSPRHTAEGSAASPRRHRDFPAGTPPHPRPSRMQVAAKDHPPSWRQPVRHSSGSSGALASARRVSPQRAVRVVTRDGRETDGRFEPASRLEQGNHSYSGHLLPGGQATPSRPDELSSSSLLTRKISGNAPATPVGFQLPAFAKTSSGVPDAEGGPEDRELHARLASMSQDDLRRLLAALPREHLEGLLETPVDASTPF